VNDVANALFVMLGVAFLIAHVRLDLPWDLLEWARPESEQSRIGMLDWTFYELLLEIPVAVGSLLVLFSFVITEPDALGLGQLVTIGIVLIIYLAVIPYRALVPTMRGAVRATAAFAPMALLAYHLYPHVLL